MVLHFHIKEKIRVRKKCQPENGIGILLWKGIKKEQTYHKIEIGILEPSKSFISKMFHIWKMSIL